MTGMRLRSAILVAAILITATVLESQGRADLPPSVSPDQWVALGNNAGIVITEKPAKVGGRPTGEVRGEIWVKVEGTWLPTHLEQPRSLVPAH
jgi:hypothetical protein